MKLALREMLVSLSLKLQSAGFVHHHDAIGRQSTAVDVPCCADEATQWRQYSAACRTQRDQPVSERQHDTIFREATAQPQRLRPLILNSAHPYATSSFLNRAHQPYVSFSKAMLRLH